MQLLSFVLQDSCTFLLDISFQILSKTSKITSLSPWVLFPKENAYKILVYFSFRRLYYVLNIHNSDKLCKWYYDFLFHFISWNIDLQIILNAWTGGIISRFIFSDCIHIYRDEIFKILRCHFLEHFVIMHLPMDLFLCLSSPA